jgi:hypothetical protein
VEDHPHIGSEYDFSFDEFDLDDQLAPQSPLTENSSCYITSPPSSPLLSSVCLDSCSDLESLPGIDLLSNSSSNFADSDISEFLLSSNLFDLDPDFLFS